MDSWERFNDDIKIERNRQISNNNCLIDSAKQPNETEKYNATNQDFFKLLEWLDWHWKTEYKLFNENQQWPVLVIFREIHNDNNVKVENFKTFISNKKYFNFLATEGADYNITYKSSILKSNVRRSIDFILSWYVWISSEAIEKYYWDDLNTYWVDTDSHTLNKSIITTNTMAQLSSLDDSNTSNYAFNKYISETIINKRNNLWLQNITNILTSSNNNNWKNFIPIIAWWLHAQDLSVQAKNFWFKWVIIFTPKSYKY